ADVVTKMHCQLVQVVMAPPSRTPAATPRLPTAPHRARAALRWDPAYVVMMSARADGVRRAALRPCIDRVAMSCPPVSANPLNSEATVNRARPVRKTVRRDSRSAVRPPSRRPPPDIIRYAVTNHWSWLPPRSRDRPIEGRAVLTTEMSSTTRIWAARATPRRAHDFFGAVASSWSRCCWASAGAECGRGVVVDIVAPSVVAVGWRAVSVVLPDEDGVCGVVIGSPGGPGCGSLR